MIIITGCARSGTSLTTGVLRASGANLGRVNKLNEHHKVRERLVKPYLASIGADPLGQYPLPALEDMKPYPDWGRRVAKAINCPEPWAYKCAKACLIWPLWHEHFPDAKWVLVRRRAKDVVASCLRTSFMQAHKDEAGWFAWVNHHEKRFAEMRENVNLIEVWPHDAVKGDTDAFRPMVEFCGLTWDREVARAQIEAGRWNA